MKYQERLQEIVEHRSAFSNFDLTGEKAKPKSVTLNTEDYDWLIEQAKQLVGTKGRYGYKDMYGLCNRDYAHLNSENKSLQERVRELEEIIESHAPNGRNYTNAQYINLLQEHQKYKKALELIANNKGMNFNYESGHIMNLWKIAQEALEEKHNELS